MKSNVNRLNVLIISLLLGLFCMKTNLGLAQDSLTNKANKLKTLYGKAVTNKGVKKYEIQFFNCFPDSFKEFVDLYGFENDKPNILYYDASDHILGLLNKIKSVNDTLYYAKLIQLCYNGKWDADAETYLQQVLREHVVNNIDLTVHLLSKKDRNQIKGFWIFYFDSPTPSKQIDKRLQIISYKDRDIYQILLAAHKYVKEYWKKNK